MKSFEFRRHSIKDGPTSAMIGPRGYLLAKEVGRLQLRDRKFDAFYASTHFRTHQTLVAFAEGAGDFRLKLAPASPPIYVVSPELGEMWKACAAAEKRGEDMVQAALAHDEALVKRTSAEVCAMFAVWSWDIPDKANVLVVGHSPHLEFLHHGLVHQGRVGTHRAGLKECQGFRVHIGTRATTVDDFATDLDPSAIRNELFP